MTQVAFIEWVRRRLAPRLRHGDIVLLDERLLLSRRRQRLSVETCGGTYELRNEGRWDRAVRMLGGVLLIAAFGGGLVTGTAGIVAAAMALGTRVGAMG